MTDNMPEQPLRLETLARELNMKSEQMVEWAARDDFPWHGDGVAKVTDVWAWAGENNLLFPGLTHPAENGTAEAASSEEDDANPLSFLDEPSQQVEYVTIRVPVIRNSGRSLPARIQQSFSLRRGDHHIRKAFGGLLAGCIASETKLSDETRVNNVSAAIRLIGELIDEEISSPHNTNNT